MIRLARLRTVLLLGCVLAAPSFEAQAATVPDEHAEPIALRTPLAFERNLGQTDAQVDFLARGPGYVLWLAGGDATLRLRSDASTVLRWRLVGAAPKPASAEATLAARSHYLSLQGTERAVRNVPHYAQVRYPDAWPGIDLVYYGDAQGQLEYDFVLAPGADPARIAFRVEGAERLALNAQGGLDIHTAGGVLTQHAPVLYQSFGTRRLPVTGRFVVRGDTVRFAVDDYQRDLALVIDPVLVWSSFLGGNGDDQAFDVAYGYPGHAYVSGRTLSTDLPTTVGVLQPSGGADADCFISKFSTDGTALTYSTYLGGAGIQYCNAIAVDYSHNVYVAGFLPSAGGDAFVAKLTPDGSALAYPTVILSGSARDEAVAIAVTGGTGVATVAGYTDSTNFPTTAGVVQSSDGAGRGAFAVRIGATGTVQWSTYLDGVGEQIAYGVAVDGFPENAYIAGRTTESDAAGDGFVVKLDRLGGAVYTALRVAGNGADAVLDINVNPLSGTGEAYVTGYTESSNLPTTAGVLQRNYSGDRDAFLAEINPAGNGFTMLTYLGGSGAQTANAIERNEFGGDLYVAGRTDTADPDGDAFLLRINAQAAQVLNNFQFGGAATDVANGLALGPYGRAWISGTTSSTDFPTTPGAFDRSKSAGQDAFVLSIGEPTDVGFLLPATVVDEGGNASVVVERQGDLSGTVTVDYTLSSGSATPGTDWSAPSMTGTLTLTSGDPRGWINLNALGDALDEDDETLVVTLSNPTGGATLRDTSHTITIRDDDPLPTLSVAAGGCSATESAGPCNFVVQLSAISGRPVSFTSATASGTAGDGADYTGHAATARSLGVGQSGMTIAVTLVNNTLAEANETFTLNITGVANATPASLSATGTIVDDDSGGAFAFAQSTYTVDELAGTLTVAVNRSGGAASGVSVQYATGNGSATAPGDYSSATGTLSFGAGEVSKSFTVAINNDTLDEDNESFAIALSNPIGGATIGTPSSATVTIVDEDAPPSIAIADQVRVEGDSGNTIANVTVGLSAASGRAVSVNWLLNNGGSPNTNGGFETPGGVNVQTFAAGQTFGDWTVETGSVDLVGSALWAPAYGSQSLDLNGNETGAIYSDLSVTSGANYTISFQLAGNPSCGPAVKTLELSFGGNVVGSYDFDTTGHNAPNLGFGVHQVTVNAAAATQRLRLRSLTPGGCGPVLDGVQVKLAGVSTASGDYDQSSGSLNFAPGETSKSIAVTIRGDYAIEPDELLFAELSGAVNAALPDPSGLVIIQNDDVAGTIALEFANYAVNENVGTLQVRALRSGGQAQDVGATLATGPGTALAGSDFTALTRRLSFAAGQTALGATIAILDDAAVESSETFSIGLAGAFGGAALGTSNASIAISDNDEAAGTLQFSASSYSANENAGAATLTVTRNSGSAGAVAVGVSIAAGTAASGADYTASTTTLSFAAGQTSRTLPIDLIDDSLDEDDETISVSLFNASGGAVLGAPILATLTIVDNDAAPTLSVDNGGCSVIEGNSGTVACDFVLRLSAISGRAVTFNTATADVSATSGADYSGHASTTRSIPAGQTTLTISVPVIGDTLAEPVETFVLNAAGVVHAVPGGVSGNGAINDDDGAPTLSIDDVTVDEGDSGPQPAAFTVTLLPASSQTVSVNWSSANDTALAGSDYDATSGVLNFAPGQTSLPLTVPVRGDTMDEPDETFRVNLTLAVNAALGDAQGQATILDDDVTSQPGALQLDVPELIAGEDDGTVRVRVHRIGGSDGTASVRVRTVVGSATAGVDYVFYDQVHVWQDGDASTAEIDIGLIDDPTPEPHKHFFVTLSEVAGATLGTPISTRVLIRDGQDFLFANGFEGQ